MNQDQLFSLIRTALKLAGGALVAHGATKTAGWINAEDTLGAVLAIAGIVWSIIHHGSGDAPPPSKPILPLLLIGALLGLAAPVGFTGCAGPPPAAVGYHTLKDTQIVVDHAMQLYGTRCAQGKVSVKDQARVDAAHAHYRAAFREAVAAARLDYSKATPENVQALTTALLNILAQL